MKALVVCSAAVVALVLSCTGERAGQQPGNRAPAAAPAGVAAAARSSALQTGYVIGPADVLSITFWRDKDMSADVTVRPDGKISLPLLNDVQAAGYTPEELRGTLVEAATKDLRSPMRQSW